MVHDLFRTSGSLATASLASGDFSIGGGVKCLLYQKGLPSSVNELLVSFCYMIFVLLIVVLFWYTRRAYLLRSRQVMIEGTNISSSRANMTQKIIISIVAVVYVTYSSMVNVFFQNFSCVSFQYDNRLRLQSDLDIICFGSEHIKWLGLIVFPIFSIVLFGAPLVTLILLWNEKRKGRLHTDININARYGFLFDGYKSKYWYWEWITLLRKIAMK
jgi:hypothetical protein